MRKILIWLVHVYKKLISPFLPPSCRYYPSCSEYAIQCLDKYSTTKAICRITFRILRCNPLFKGGVDLP